MDEMNQRTTLSSAATYRFGLFTLDVSAGSLTRSGIRIKLQDQPFQLLVLLLEKSGEIVTRDEIRQRLWESNTFVDFDRSLGVAVLKVREALGDSAANPRFLETVPRRGYRFISPVSVVPSSRPPVVSESVVAENLSSRPVSSPPSSTIPTPGSITDELLSRSRRSRIGYIALALCVTVALGFFAFRFYRPPHRPGIPSKLASTQPKLRRSVAVLGFRNVAGGANQNWLSTALTEMLNTELAAKGDLRMVSGEDVANVKRDLSLPVEDTLAKNTLARLGSNLEADIVIVGSYTLLNDGGKNRIRLDIRAQDTALGETIFEYAITGNENDLFDLASQAGSRLRESLNPSMSLAPETETSRFEGSSNQLALQFYSEGRARLYEFDFVGARNALQRAVAADPGFAAAHSALSNAWDSLGYESLARDEAKRALQPGRDLPQETALAIQGQYQESIRDWANAAITYQKMLQLFPDNLDYGLKLAKVQLNISSADSKHTLAMLRALPPPLGDDPRIDLMEASVLIGQDLPKARAAAERAIAKASAKRATLMVARGYGILCQQDSSFGGSLDRSISECNLARSSYASAGDQNNAARALNDIAGVYYQHGDLLKAQGMWEKAIVVFRKVGDTEGLAASSNNVGDVYLTTGKLAEAEKLLGQSLAGYRLVGDRTGVALAMVDLGQIALDKANLSEAKRDYEQAITIGTQAGDKSSTAFGFAGLGDIYLEQDQLAEARKQYETAIKLRTELGEKQNILETRIALARLAIEDGHPVVGDSEARLCKAEAHEQELADDELRAGLVVVSALLNQQKYADAKREIDALGPLEEKSQDRKLHFLGSLELARVLSADHEFDTSRKILEKAENEAEASGYAGVAGEARMTRAEVQREAGDVLGSKQQLKLVEGRERSAGLLLLARKAGDSATK